MKIKVILLSVMSLVMVERVAAQIEQDDMYFNSKDRAKQREAEKTNALAIASSRSSDRNRDEESNPTDSYSARNVNPEFVSRQNSKTAQSDQSDYYVANYQSASRYYNNWNNNYNQWYNSPWYSNNYWGPSINSWNSPYYGSAYDSWGNPWANPYYRSGFSTAFSYYGNSWNYGLGMNSCYTCGMYGGMYGSGMYGGYGYYDPFYGNYNPYYGYNSFYYNNYWGSPYTRYYNSYAGGYYPVRTVYVSHDNGYRATYGKRNSRSSQLNRDFAGGRSNGNLIEDINRNRSTSGGRTRDQQHYDNAWRNSSSYGTQRSVNWSNNSNSNSRTSSWGNNSNSNTRSSWESQQRTTTHSSPTRSFDAGRSSFPSSGGGGGHSSGGSGSRSHH